MVSELLNAQSRDNALKIYYELKDNKKIFWKDSIKKVVGQQIKNINSKKL